MTRSDPHFPQSWNRYAYVGGTPLEATDPSGLLAVVPGGCVGMPSADPTTGDYYMCPDNGGLPSWQEPTDGGDGGVGGGGGTGPNDNPPDNKTCPNGTKDITVAQGQQIITASNRFTGYPYSQQVCNQFVCNAINASDIERGLVIYITTSSLPSSPFFRKVGQPQIGDLVLFNGHVAFYNGPNSVLGAVVHQRGNATPGIGLPQPEPATNFGPVQGYYRLQVCR